MSVWNKVLLVLIFLCAAGFVYLGSGALKSRRDSQKKLQEARTALQNEQQKNHEYLYGAGKSDGYLFLVNDVNRIRQIRGTRIWPHCLPHAAPVVNENKVTLSLLVDAKPETPVEGDLSVPMTPEADGETQVVSIPPEARVLPGSVVYLFDTRDLEQGGCFLGEFVVDKVEKDIASLVNSYLMTPQEIERINTSVAQLAPWAVYTVLPKNIANSVASSEDAAESTAETDVASIRENLAADPSLALAQTFTSLNLKRMQLHQHVEMLKTQITLLENAKKPTGQMIEFYQQEIAETQTQLRKTEGQLAEVEKIYNATVDKTKKLEELVANLKAANKKMLADLTDAQINVSEIINQRDASLSMSR